MKSHLTLTTAVFALFLAAPGCEDRPASTVTQDHPSDQSHADHADHPDHSDHTDHSDHSDHKDHTNPAPDAADHAMHGAHQLDSDWYEPDERDAIDLNFTMTDQDGRELSLQDLAGKPMAVSFIYTRCPMPNMCPLITSTMARLQRKAAEAGIDKHIHLLLITYDPAYDFPARLKTYGTQRGLRYTNAKMLRPDPDTAYELFRELDIAIAPNPAGDGTFGHFMEIALIDHQSRIASNTRGGIWDNVKVLSQLQTLVNEMKSNAGQ